MFLITFIHQKCANLHFVVYVNFWHTIWSVEKFHALFDNRRNRVSPVVFLDKLQTSAELRRTDRNGYCALRRIRGQILLVLYHQMLIVTATIMKHKKKTYNQFTTGNDRRSTDLIRTLIVRYTHSKTCCGIISWSKFMCCANSSR